MDRNLQSIQHSGKMAVMMPYREERKARPPLILFLILLAAAILIIGDLNRRMAETHRLERDAQVLQTEVAVKKTENAVLRTEVAGATSEARIMDWAHEHGGMAREGEVLVVPVAPPNTDILPTPTPAPSVEPPTPWDVWRALLFGD